MSELVLDAQVPCLHSGQARSTATGEICIQRCSLAEGVLIAHRRFLLRGFSVGAAGIIPFQAGHAHFEHARRRRNAGRQGPTARFEGGFVDANR